MHRIAADRDLRGVVAFMLTIGIPTMVAFLASGLWHGAGWTFIMFGLANGIGLMINHAWREAGMPKLPKALAWTLTAITILVTLVYFRSESLAQAHYMLKTMFWPDRIDLPLWAADIAAKLHMQANYFDVFQAANFTLRFIAILIVLAPLSVLLPNPSAQPFKVEPTFRTAFAVAAMAWLTLGWLGEPRTFLYFQF
jgi:alginate O-acetyltransferase complex protein AlgI